MPAENTAALKLVLAASLSMLVTGGAAWFTFKTTPDDLHCQQCHEGLLHLDKLHSPIDEDGVPLWYVPRSLGVSLESIVDDQRKMVDAQLRLVDTLARLESKLN